MGQPTPPGDIPLYDGLGSEWNDIVSGFPEDRRGELAASLKSRVDSYAPLKDWEQFASRGVKPEAVDTALRLYNHIEANPRQVYDSLAQHLGISAAEVKEAVENVQEGDTDDDPRIAAMERQIATMAQIMMTQHESSLKSSQEAEMDRAVKKEFEDLRAAHPDVNDSNEAEIAMRMAQYNLSAEDAYQQYTNFVENVRKSRPAPNLMGGAGSVPGRAIDPTKLDPQQTRNMVAQMLQHGINEGR